MIYKLSEEERTRLLSSIAAALRIPFIAGIEDFVFETIFHYVKGLPLPDPRKHTRSKLLFDVVDSSSGIGWSAKSHQGIPSIGATFEVVIQRADIFKKREALGYPTLSIESKPEDLGAAILRHWNSKVIEDMRTQGVTKPRVAILLKSNDHLRYALLEQDLRIFRTDELKWSWTDSARNGLQAREKRKPNVALRWYPNQKQLFESFTLAADCYQFEVNLRAIAPADLVRLLSNAIQ